MEYNFFKINDINVKVVYSFCLLIPMLYSKFRANLIIDRFTPKNLYLIYSLLLFKTFR